MTFSPKTLLCVAALSVGSAFVVASLFSAITRRLFRDKGEEDERRLAIRKANPVAPRGFTKEELQCYDGAQRPEVYTSVKGVVYEVAPQHYGPGQSYHVFAGKEISRCLALSIVGNGPANKDWMVGITAEQQKTLDGWSDMFQGKYPVVGWIVQDSSFTEGI
jgi:membrane-associated progesterone receptor component